MDGSPPLVGDFKEVARLPDEPYHWWLRFIRYYLPMGRRTVNGARNIFMENDADGQEVGSVALWYKMRDTYKWDERAAAFDEARGKEDLNTIREATNELHKHSMKAVQTLVESLKHDSPHIRLRAAIAILDRAGISPKTMIELSGGITAERKRTVSEIVDFESMTPEVRREWYLGAAELFRDRADAELKKVEGGTDV